MISGIYFFTLLHILYEEKVKLRYLSLPYPSFHNIYMYIHINAAFGIITIPDPKRNTTLKGFN